MKWLLTCVLMSAAFAADRFVIIYDASAVAPLAGGWGYSALVEYHGKRILFDAGPKADALLNNAKLLTVDLAKLDAVVISHDDPDHYGGLEAVRAANSSVKVWVPEQAGGAFSTSLLNHVVRFVQGALPGQHLVDAPAGLNYVRVSGNTELFPGVRLLQLGFGDRREQALTLDVPGGIALLTGCGHPGIVEFIKRSGSRVRLAAGGFHLMTLEQAEVRRIVQGMKQNGVDRVCPSHCTGRFATEELRRVFGAKAEIVSVGSAIALSK